VRLCKETVAIMDVKWNQTRGEDDQL